MPEGPEVKVLTGQLNERCSGKKLESIEIVSEKWLHQEKWAGLRSSVAQINNIASRFPVKVLWVKCKGKNIFWCLEADREGTLGYKYILNHLGMTGTWQEEKDEYTKAVIRLEGVSLYFSDARELGKMSIASGEELKKVLADLGPDVLESDEEIILNRLKEYHHSRMKIGNLIVDQKVLAGVGNYLRADILYLARIAPETRTCDIPEKKLSDLAAAILKVCRDSYQANGNTIRDYKHLSGIGEYQPLIYGKEADAEGREVQKITMSNRTVYWVPEVQVVY